MIKQSTWSEHQYHIEEIARPKVIPDLEMFYHIICYPELESTLAFLSLTFQMYFYHGKSDSPGAALLRRCIESLGTYNIMYHILYYHWIFRNIWYYIKYYIIESFGTSPHFSFESSEAFARIVAVAMKNFSTWKHYKVVFII